MSWLQSTGTTIADVHRHAGEMQRRFLAGLARLGLGEIAPAHLVPPPGVARGNFLAFVVDDAEDRHRRIAAEGITIDRRDRRLRFGFGVYHDDAGIDRLLETLEGCLS